MIMAFVTAALCVAFDFITKYLAVRFLAPDSSAVVWDGVLNFTYVENRGMAFGMLSDNRILFMAASTVMLVALIVFLFYYRKQANTWLKVSCGLVLGGGIGNMIDRVRLGYVVDFIDVRLFDFWKWVFNVADMCVCVGVFMLALYLIADSIICEREKRHRERLAETAEEDEVQSEAEEDYD